MPKTKVRKPKTNYVRIGVTFPDGCWHTQQMNDECEEAHDAVKFANFIIELGEEVLERATRIGLCAQPASKAVGYE